MDIVHYVVPMIPGFVLGIIYAQWRSRRNLHRDAFMDMLKVCVCGHEAHWHVHAIHDKPCRFQSCRCLLSQNWVLTHGKDRAVYEALRDMREREE